MKETINKKALRLSSKLPPLTDKQTEYATNLFKNKAIIQKGFAYCLECGHKFVYEGQEECPHCGEHFDEVEKSRRVSWKKDTPEVLTIITTKEDLQIVRNFYVFQWTCPRHQAKYEIYEATQWFISAEGEEACMARRRRFMARYIDDFDYSYPMTLRKRHSWINYQEYKDFTQYFFSGEIYPHVKLLPIFKRNGCCKAVFEASRYSPHHIIKDVLHEPKYETLIKAKRLDIADSLTIPELRNYWSQIKLCLRHHYYPTDFQMWTDTIRMVRDCEYDEMSPKYVLPEDLKAMHDLFVKRHKKVEQRREREEKKKEEDKYIWQNKKYFKVKIKVNDITIEPLRNYDDFWQEAEHMHHCVMTYLGKPHCLILSAKEKGKRLATIELNTKDLKVVQCRGVNNCVPQHYQKMVDTMQRNMYRFAKAS